MFLCRLVQADLLSLDQSGQHQPPPLDNVYLEFQALFLEPRTPKTEGLVFSRASLIHQFCFNRILKDTDLADFDFNNISRFHEDLRVAFKAHTTRSSTDDHIARL